MSNPHEEAETSERLLVPRGVPPAERPRGPERPCPACGVGVEPLRAVAVAAFDDGLRYFCSPVCLRAYRGGERAAVRASQSHGDGRLTPRTVPATARARRLTPAGGEAGIERRPASLPRFLWPASALLSALVSALWAQVALCALLSASLSGLAVTLAAAWSRPKSSISSVHVAHYLPCAGVLLAVCGAYERALALGAGGLWPLAMVALASAVQTLRYGRASVHLEPIERALRALTPVEPVQAQEPAEGAADTLRMQLKAVPVESLRTGREVVVRSGDILPVDGIVVAGSAELLPYVGAAQAHRCAPGDAVLAGARVIRGALRLAATHVGSVRRLHRFRAAVASGVGRWATPFPRLDRQLRRWGALLTLLLAALSGMAVACWGAAELSFGGGLMVAGSVVLVAPLHGCRVALHQPFVAAAAHGAQRGLLFRDAKAVDAAGRVAEVVMRPRGVLTTAAPEVTGVFPTGPEPAERLLAWIAGAERGTSGSGLANGILGYAAQRGVEPSEVRRPVFHRGLGISAMTVDKEPLLLGSRRLLLESGVSVAVADAILRRHGEGHSAVLLAIGGHVRGVLLMRETVRDSAVAAIRRLSDLGMSVQLLSGDQRPAVEALLEGFQGVTIKADLTPQERIEAVQARREVGAHVAAIGVVGPDDGLLAAADVGIGLHAADTSAGEPAVALLGDEVGDAAAALWMARVTRIEALRSARWGLLAFLAIWAAIGCGFIGPFPAAVAALVIDELCLSSGARLLRQFALRLPAHS